MADDLRLLPLAIERRIRLITETCNQCSAIFAMEESFQKERVRDKRAFYCPNGHSISYVGKTEAEKLREQLDEERRARQRAEQQVEYQAQARQAETARADRERNRANGYKGHATRISKRVKHGVCICCNRTFKDLQRHMATKHPTFTPIEIEQQETVQ